MKEVMKDQKRFGKSAGYRYRAEILLTHYHERLTDQQKEVLERIAASPNENDWAILAPFDSILGDDDDDEGDEG